VTDTPRFQLLLISDGAGDEARLERRLAEALSVLPNGAAAVQVREKALATRALVALCRRLQPLCRAHLAPLLVNDRCDVALALGLDGVHLAQSSITAVDARALLGAEALLGVSCHDLTELGPVVGDADYAVWGPLFPPRSKASGRAPIGLESLREATAFGVPLYALGGIGPENAATVRAHGARGLAVIGSGLGADNPAGAVSALWRAWNESGA
jgi:thiamine-phosphate pyrophosphorylase